MKSTVTISRREWEDYERLKAAERSGQLISTDVLRMIARSCEYDPAKVGQHFLGVLANRKREKN